MLLPSEDEQEDVCDEILVTYVQSSGRRRWVQ